MLEIFTIVLNGMPFIKEHEAIFNRLSVPWRWHIIEGVATPTGCTNWCSPVLNTDHKNGLSTDGTTEYLDKLAGSSSRVKVYRKAGGKFWNGKLEMCNAPLINIAQGAVLHEIDVDEFWTHKQLELVYKLFSQDGVGRGWYHCDYYLGPDIHVTNNAMPAVADDYAWIRTHRYSGLPWMAHEPPNIPYLGRNAMHAETERLGLIFKHFAYSTEAQLRFKENYYRYSGALNAWHDLQANTIWPTNPGIFLPWVGNAATVDRTEPFECSIIRMQHAMLPRIKPEQLPALYKDHFAPGHWTKRYIDKLIATPSEPEDYPHALEDLHSCLFDLALNLSDLKILVLGSLSPWIECFLINRGARVVYTSDVNEVRVYSPLIKFVPDTELKPNGFDLVVSYSSVEHAGLGRYGDAIADDGDLYLMQRVRRLLKAGGIALLGVPVAESYKLDFPWHRIYSSNRLQALTAGFSTLFSYKYGVRSETVDFKQDARYSCDWQNQPVIALKRQPLISFVLVSRNDNFEGKPIERLKLSLAENIKNLDATIPGEYEILIGDWGSEEKITRQMLGIEGVKNVRLFYFPVEVTRMFDSAFDEVHPLNFLVRTSEGRFIARLDQDIMLGASFLSYLRDIGLDRAMFYWSTRRDLDESSSLDDSVGVVNCDPNEPDFYKAAIGIIIASRAVWHTIKGYNEAYIHRNHMEHDLYQRLCQRVGLVNLGVLLDSPFYHIYHTRSAGAARKWNEIQKFENDENWGLAKYSNLITEQ